MRIAVDAAALALINPPEARERSLAYWGGLIGAHPEHAFLFLNLFDDFSLCQQLGRPQNLCETLLSPGPGAVLLREARLAGVLGDVVRQFCRRERVDLFVLSGPMPRGYTGYLADWFAGTPVCMPLAPGAVCPDFVRYSAPEAAFALGAALGLARTAPPAQRARLAFFSPLPPEQSGIADYSADVLNALAPHFEIDAFTEHGQPVSVPLAQGVRVLAAAAFEPEAYQHILYQMGNSTFHAYMLPWIRRAPGVVVMHDVNLHMLAAALTLRHGDEAEYLRMLSPDFPEAEVLGMLEEVKAGRQSIPYFEMTVNGFVAGHAKRILTHSLFAKEQLLRRNAGYDVRQIPHYARVTEPGDRAQARAALGIAPDTPLICAFGHISRTKRVVPLLLAFARLHRARPEARLVLVGKYTDDCAPELEAIIAREQLSQAVTVTGFAPMETFYAYMAAADVCPNLRYPDGGESSGSLMRLLAQGKCVMLNDTGSFAEVPDDCCVKLPSVEFMNQAEEVTRLEEALARLLEDPQARDALSARARAFAAETLDLDKVAPRYAELIRDPLTPSLSEEDLRRLRAALPPNQRDDPQLRALAHTLAYSKNPHPEPCIAQRPLRTRDIMSALRAQFHAKT